MEQIFWLTDLGSSHRHNETLDEHFWTRLFKGALRGFNQATLLFLNVNLPSLLSRQQFIKKKHIIFRTLFNITKKDKSKVQKHNKD